MNWFKRLYMFVFGLSGLLALSALCLTWVGPWTAQVRSLLEVQWFMITLEVLVCVSAFGLVLCILVPLFYPRNPRETAVADVAGGTITVTRAAIVARTKQIVEADGSCAASSVRVRMKKRGNIRIDVRVTPHRPVDVVKRGEALYAELQEGLTHVCGDSVKSISLVFNEPEQPEQPSAQVGMGDDSRPSAATSKPISVPLASVAPSSTSEASHSDDAGQGMVFAFEGNPVDASDAVDESANTLSIANVQEEA